MHLRDRVQVLYQAYNGDVSKRGLQKWFREQLSEWGPLDVDPATMSRWLRKGQCSLDAHEAVEATIEHLGSNALHRLEGKAQAIRAVLPDLSD